MRNDKNYFVVQGWMVSKLKLTGNDLLVYALIYGFSQDGKNSFYGSTQYIADTIGASKRTVISTLQRLTENGLLDKQVDDRTGVKYCHYRAIGWGGEEIAPVVKYLHEGGEESSSGVVKNFHQGGEELSPNNLLDNAIKKKKEDNTQNGGKTAYLDSPFYQDALFIAQELERLHKDFVPSYTGNPKRWAKDIELLLRKKDKDEVMAVLRWTKNPKCFWFSNIMSGSSFKREYDRLLAQMLSEREKDRPLTDEEILRKLGMEDLI